MKFKFMLLVVFLFANGISNSNENPNEKFENDMGAGCKVSMYLPLGAINRVGHQDKPYNYYGLFGSIDLPKEWNQPSSARIYFDTVCVDKDSPKSYHPLLSRYNAETDTWVKDASQIFSEIKEQFGAKEAKEAVSKTQVYDVKASNAHGWAETYEESEDEMAKFGRTAMRWMKFCVYHADKTFCGGGIVGIAGGNPKDELTPHVLEILRTIEFIDDAPDSSEPAPATH